MQRFLYDSDIRHERMKQHIFKTLSNIDVGGFCENSQRHEHYIRKTLHPSYLTEF